MRWLPEVGFEPTLSKETELKSAALDHSAIQAMIQNERRSGPTGIWTRIVGFKVQSDNQLHHRTIMLDYIWSIMLIMIIRCIQSTLPWLSWQSGRLLTDRSPVRARLEASTYTFACKQNNSAISSVVRIRASQAWGPGSIPGWRSEFSFFHQHLRPTFKFASPKVLVKKCIYLRRDSNPQSQDS